MDCDETRDRSAFEGERTGLSMQCLGRSGWEHRECEDSRCLCECHDEEYEDPQPVELFMCSDCGRYAAGAEGGFCGDCL